VLTPKKLIAFVDVQYFSAAWYREVRRHGLAGLKSASGTGGPFSRLPSQVSFHPCFVTEFGACHVCKHSVCCNARIQHESDSVASLSRCVHARSSVQS